MKALRERVTLKTMASHVGLGRSTVSLILNGRGNELGIRPETQSRVLKASQQLGYRPNSLALGLVGKRTQTVGLLLSSGFYFPQNLMPQEISMRLYREGYQAYLADSLHDKNVILESLAEIASRRVDGVVFFPYHNHYLTPAIREALNQFSVSVLLAFEPIIRDTLHSHLVCVKLEYGANEMMGHFVKTARRRPLMVVGLGPSNEAKVAAFKNALQRHGYDSRDETAIFGVPSISPGKFDNYTHFMRQFETHNLAARDFDALFCTCDDGAIAAVNYLKKRGIRVPEDVAVVGLDDTPLIQGFQPPLASISWRHRIACDLVIQRLIEKLNHPDMEPVYDELPTQFVWRESAG